MDAPFWGIARWLSSFKYIFRASHKRREIISPLFFGTLKNNLGEQLKYEYYCIYD